MSEPDKIYVGDIGTAIVVDCGCDVSGATTSNLEIKLPDGALATWPAEVASNNGDPNCLRYVTKAGDLAQVGQYRGQARLTLPGGWEGRGGTFKFTVYAHYK